MATQDWYEAERIKEAKIKKYVTYGVVALVSLIVLLTISPFTVVSPGERAVILNFGKIDRVLPEGMHFVMPISESVVTMDISTKNSEVTSGAASKDLQNVTAVVSVNYQVDPSAVAEVYEKFLGDHDSRLIQPSIQEAVKAATARYTADELITKREAVRGDISDILKTKLEQFHIIVGNISIVNFQFSPGFEAAIEAKVKAEQDALAEKNKLEQVKYKAEQTIASARAEAESIRLQGDAANSANYIRLKELEVRLEYAKKWNGNLPQNLYSGAPIPFIDVK